MFTDESWRGKMQAASAEIDDRFGEEFIVGLATKRPNHRAEPTGDFFSIMAVFSYRSETVFSHDAITRQSGGALVESRKPIVSFSHRACPYNLIKGDVLTRCVDGTQWDITVVKPDGVSRIVLDVVQRGLAQQ